MKNHFYISYFGNKRMEADILYNELDLEGVDTIVEPFCGSCAMSYYMWLKHPDFNFVSNDKNKFLYDMNKTLINDEELLKFQNKVNETVDLVRDNKTLYNEVVKKKDLLGWFIGCRFFAIKYNLNPSDQNRNRFKHINFKEYPIYNF